jgi:hypothetical protein
MSKFEIDYDFGKKWEKEILDKINIRWKKDEILETKNLYSKYDYEGKKYKYELKSRRNSYNQYPTTLIAKDKILNDKKQIFLFNFTDGLYYIKYRESKFQNYKCKLFRRYDRGNIDLEKFYYYIPIEDLKKI